LGETQKVGDPRRACVCVRAGAQPTTECGLSEVAALVLQPLLLQASVHLHVLLALPLPHLTI